MLLEAEGSIFKSEVTVSELAQILQREKHTIPRHYRATATNNQANSHNTQLNLLTLTFFTILK